MGKSVTFVIFLYMILAGNTFSQIVGRVIDNENEKPLSGANIYLAINKTGTTSDKNGFFRIEDYDPHKIDTLVIHYLGYRIYKTPLHLFTDEQTVKLIPVIIQLGKEIRIIGERLDLTKQEVPHLRESFEFEELQRHGNSEISDLFKQMPSVRIEGNDIDGRQIQIRGSDADEVKVYIDGILINIAGSDNTADLSIISTESIERLEVLKGANLLLLGHGAFGGVINVSTRRNSVKEYQFGIKYGDFNSRFLFGRLNYPVNKNFYFNYMIQYSQMSPEIEYFPGEQYSTKSKNDQIKSTKQNHNLNFKWLNSLNQIDAKIYLYKFDYAKPRWENVRYNYLTALAIQGEVFGMKELGLFASTYSNDDRVVRRKSGSAQFITDYVSNNLNFRITKKYASYPFDLQLSGEYLHEELEQDSHLKDLASDNSFYKAFLYDNRGSGTAIFSLSDTTDQTADILWKTFAGIRYDILANGRSDFTRAFGLQMNLTQSNMKSKIHLSYGKNIKYPTLIENAYVNDFIDFRSIDSLRENLNPELVSSVELGADIEFINRSDKYQKLVLKAAVFRNHIENKLLRQPFNETIIQAQNGENETIGIEASTRFQRIWNIGDIIFGGNYLNISNPLLYAYKPESNLSLKFDQYRKDGFYSNITFFHEGKSYAWYYDQDYEVVNDPVESFFDMDMTAGYKLILNKTVINVKFSAYNIFDNSGYKYYYLKKRYLQIALSVKY